MSRTGRPPLGEQKLVRRVVYLTPEQVIGLMASGNGNVSTGLREALELLGELVTWHRQRMDPTVMAGPAPRHNKQR